MRAYRTVSGRKVYGYFSKPGEWKPDWTINQIYEEAWKYVEAMKFPMYEWDGEHLVPKADGSTYSWKHVIGSDLEKDDYVYTNPLNGNTVVNPSTFEKWTPKTSNWGVLWPVLINPYMTHASIMKKIKGKLDVEMADLSRANPLYWDDDINALNGADTFCIYYEKYGNGYKLWQLW